MRPTRRTMLGTAIALCATAPAFAQAHPSLDWRELEPGLALASFRTGARMGDRLLYALRIDPGRYEFVLLTRRLIGARAQTARAWARVHGLLAATNAGMFALDGRPVAYAKAGGRVVSPRVTRDRSVFVFGASDGGPGGARLIDRACESFDPDEHANALQGIRMIGCRGENVWTRQNRFWSIAALATDAQGRVLFLHTRSPFAVHGFIEILRAPPFSLVRCMYLEGGPEATLYVRAGDVELERFGSYETGYHENDDNPEAWPLPNVLGVRRRAA